MSILRRLLKLISFIYITGKWLGLFIILGPFAKLMTTDSSLLSSDEYNGFLLIAIVSFVVPLIVVSIFEWIVFGKFTWSYASFSQYGVQSIKDEAEITEAVAEQEEYNRKNASVIEHQKRVNNTEALLRSKGYRLKSNGKGWIVKEPLGGRQSIGTLDELEQYARSREKA